MSTPEQPGATMLHPLQMGFAEPQDPYSNRRFQPVPVSQTLAYHATVLAPGDAVHIPATASPDTLFPYVTPQGTGWNRTILPGVTAMVSVRQLAHPLPAEAVDPSYPALLDTKRPTTEIGTLVFGSAATAPTRTTIEALRAIDDLANTPLNPETAYGDVLDHLSRLIGNTTLVYSSLQAMGGGSESDVPTPLVHPFTANPDTALHALAMVAEETGKIGLVPVGPETRVVDPLGFCFVLPGSGGVILTGSEVPCPQTDSAPRRHALAIIGTAHQVKFLPPNDVSLRLAGLAPAYTTLAPVGTTPETNLTPQPEAQAVATRVSEDPFAKFAPLPGIGHEGPSGGYVATSPNGTSRESGSTQNIIGF